METVDKITRIKDKENLISNNILELIGNTPLVRLNRVINPKSAEVLCKMESFNPGSSVKDRIGLAMIEKAEQLGVLKPGATIIEPTSGNTGIGLAMTAAVKGYRILLVMPSSMSIERRKLLISLGAEIVLTDADKGMPGALEQAEILCENIPNSFMPKQFHNLANPEIHYKTTGPEIWKATRGKLDFFIAGVGTGGTISGAGKYLKEKDPNIQIIAVEPDESAVLSGDVMGPHMIQGIGAGFIPEILDTSVIDRVVRVDSHTSIDMAKALAKQEGMVVGISAGAAVAAAKSLSDEKSNQGKRMLVVLPDTGERYISTLLFYED